MPAALAARPAPAPLQHRPPRRQRSAPRLAASASTRVVELEDGSATVVAPTRRRPKGIVHFLGGAFVAAVPQLSYSLFLERLADGGYTCVATPYAVTFKHIECAQAVNGAFEAALAAVRGGAADGLGAWAAPVDAPTHGVGHSNGALLHLLIGSVCLPDGGGGATSAPNPAAAAAAAGAGSGASSLSVSSGGAPASSSSRASNVLISYNNLQVAEAVPVPLGLLQPAVQQLRGQGTLAGATRQALEQAAQAAQQLLAAGGGADGASWQLTGRQRGRQLLAGLQQLDPALIQLGSVFDEVGDGYQDFTPTPTEARRLISASYAVPSTLLVQFTDDNTDETPEAEDMLSGSGSYAAGSWGGAGVSAGSAAAGNGSNGSGRSAGAGGTVGQPPPPKRAVRRLVLPGTHVTPCGGSLAAQLPPRSRFGPAEALAMAAAAAVQRDTHRLADRVLQHLDAHS